MSFRKELYFLILYFFLGQSFGQEIFTESFETELSSGKVTTKCDFKIFFKDEQIIKGKGKEKSKVKCKSFKTKKPFLNIDHIRETKSMHILTLKLRISKSGETLIKDSSNVETSKIF